MKKDKKPKKTKVITNKNKNKNQINININSNNKKRSSYKPRQQPNHSPSIFVSTPSVPYIQQDNGINHLYPIIHDLREKVNNLHQPKPAEKVHILNDFPTYSPPNRVYTPINEYKSPISHNNYDDDNISHISSSPSISFVSSNSPSISSIRSLNHSSSRGTRDINTDVINNLQQVNNELKGRTRRTKNELIEAFQMGGEDNYTHNINGLIPAKEFKRVKEHRIRKEI
jgi:hypothetical protein